MWSGTEWPGSEAGTPSVQLSSSTSSSSEDDVQKQQPARPALVRDYLYQQ